MQVNQKDLGVNDPLKKKKAKHGQGERDTGAHVAAMEDLIGRRKTELKQKLFMFDRDSSIVPILGNYDLPKTMDRPPTRSGA